MKLSPSARGYKVRRGSYLHIKVAESAINKPLPIGAVVHHVDCDPANNASRNLVICPDQKYHFLLHRRQRAISAGFPAHYLRCHICKGFGDPLEMYSYEKSGSSMHIECQRKLNHERRRK